MPLPTLNHDYARWRALRLLVDLVVDDYDTLTERIIAQHYDGDPTRFEAALRDGFNVGVPTADQMRELINLIASTTTADYTLGYEDRDFLTRVRSHLCDALAACLAGDVEGVASNTDKASKQLHFLTYERKRTDKRDYHNPFSSERARFERLTARTTQLARQLDRVAVYG